ncbi:hypothetical protein JCM19275_860 [Nonlabens ulvanivorans]|uniref:Secretion system C-terminal sorting domain-containing protein n=1 Tax=Nonlabens ulvanivorans TaxID=906888 RepID=A0A090WCX1_NONUL|nr:T9SS type A sorting domain-containing protein [Nonlabens ulvanivorans]GAL74821.1 hypothetical protein JCM19275_860 [Nonlabens ulvanivorans]
MKNFILSILAVLFISSLSAQVYVGDGFIYSKGTNLYAKGKINLSTNGKLYLRNEAQLIQGDDVDNEGAGVLSVFQEGTSNEYTYNYWGGSPVGQATSIGNQDFDLNSQIYFPTLQEGFTETGFNSSAPNADLRTNLVIDASIATISGTSDATGTTDAQDASLLPGDPVTNPLKISGRWLYKYDTSGATASYGSWRSVQGSTDVEPGVGFTMKGVVQSSGPNLVNVGTYSTFFGQRYDFRGRPNNGTINVNVNVDNVAVVGNPYPSALDLKSFLEDNVAYDGMGDFDTSMSQIDAVVYFWESKSTSHQLTDYIGGYGSYVPNGFDPGTEDGYDNNGTYVQAAYSRYNTDGTPSSGSTAGGTDGLTGPIGTLSRRYAPIGQGFVVTRSLVSGTNPDGFNVSDGLGSVEFNNSQRAFYKESDGSLSFFAAAPGSNNNNPINSTPAHVLPKIRFNVAVNDLYVRELVLQFHTSTTMGRDIGWEAPVSQNKQANDVYMPVANQGLIINSIPFSTDKKVPLSFDLTSNSSFDFSIKTLENFDTPFILLHDKQTNTIYDLKNGTSTISLAAGTIDDRFEIIFQDPTTLSNDEIVNAEKEFDIVQNNSRQELTIFNPNGIEVSNISLFDLAGKELISSNEGTSNNAYTFETSNFSAGIYIVRVITADQREAAVKVSISN